jgi:hypothetical protein
MTNKQIEKAVEEIWALFRETDKRIDQRFKETDQRFKETDQRFKETDRQLKELGKQIGGLGNKFGGFTEGMAFPSIRRILTEKFKMDYVGARIQVRKNGETMEFDVLAYANRDINEVYVVEVKSRLRDEDLEKMLNDLKRLPEFLPEYKDKALYGIIAAVDVTEEMKRRVLDAGLYLALIRDDTFWLDVPEDFEPKRFN